MDTRDKFVGAWELTDWVTLLNGEFYSYPFGEGQKGRLIYGAGGNMMVILMQSDRPKFAASMLSKGSPEEKDAAISGYVSYSGTFRTEGDRMIHSVDFSLLPNWIGTELIRTITWDEGDLILESLPTQTRSGKVISNRLRWRRESA
ncbi:MAG: lipocalin-like domain-containing protein [Chloroflexota bacterium]